MASLFRTAAFVLFWIFLWSFVHAQNTVCPAACSCLFPMVDCSERGLTEIPTDLPHWVEILELRSNEIAEINQDAFRGLTSLKQLDLSNNKLTRLDPQILSYVPSLTELKLANNKYTDIPHFGRNSNITKLVLHHNQISVIRPELLSGLTRLKELDLNFNHVAEITSSTFSSRLGLQQLFLNNNSISNIELGSFDNIPSLHSLKLNRNRLSNLPKKLFSKLKSLKTLELSRNHLRTIDGLVFHGLESLLVLKLRKNKIEQLMDGAFWGLSSIETLQLDQNNIRSVDKGWLYGLSSLKQLSLARNQISTINPGWEFCPELSELVLSHNKLRNIPVGTFSKLFNLKKLHLSQNKLRDIEDGALTTLGNLEELKLANNHISWSVEDLHGIFSELRKLQSLGLQSNQIKSISKKAFTGLDKLKQLDLRGNNISSIQDNAFANMEQLTDLFMNTNNLVCDCQISWLTAWLQLKGFQTTVHAKCGHPDWMKGKTIYEVQQEDLVCKDSPKPIIVVQPKTQVALKGTNVTLNCTAASSSDSPMHFQWKKDNQIMTTVAVENYAASEGDVIKHTTSIHMLYVQDEAEGRYQCIMSNDFGATYSQKAKISVHVFPVMTKTPSDITVKAGSIARLECAANGQPKPEIAWQKDGGDDFPAARERRLQMISDDMFVIKRVSGADQGVYSCTATNPAGTVVASANLTVLEPPSFMKPMLETKITDLGGTAVIECLTSGSPKPKVTWFKDGKPLQATERHFFTSNNELMIIVEAKAKDQGQYMCEMSNTLGTERGSTMLFVRTENGDIVNNKSEILPGLDNESTTTGIIIIAVVCCVVGTSLVWVIIIYQTRKKNEEYLSTPTDETTIREGPEMRICPEDREMSTNSSDPSKSDTFLEYQGSRGSHSSTESPKFFGKNGKLRTAAIFPSDVSDDDHHQLTEGHNSQSSLDQLYVMNQSDSDSVRTSHSAHSNLHNGGTLPLRTFRPQDSSTDSLPRVTDNPITRFLESNDPPCTVAVVHRSAGEPITSHNTNLALCDRVPGCNCGQCHLVYSDEYHGSRPPGDCHCYVEVKQNSAMSTPHPHCKHSLPQGHYYSTGIENPANPSFVNNHQVTPYISSSQHNQSNRPSTHRSPSIPASIPVPPCRTC